MGKKQQGYVGVIRGAQDEVLGYAFEPRIKVLWESASEVLDVLKELQECSTYWSEYDVPIGIQDRIKNAIAKAEGRQE